MKLAAIFQHYLCAFKARHGHHTNPDQWSALNAILGCRTEQYGHLVLACKGCHQPALCYQSCGHRACNQCQHHSASQWLARQQRKLLPVDYFMATFTLPSELRELAKANPKKIYALLFDYAVSTLKDFGLNKKSFAAELAMTAVLHTHTRRLDYHPKDASTAAARRRLYGAGAATHLAQRLSPCTRLRFSARQCQTFVAASAVGTKR